MHAQLIGLGEVLLSNPKILKVFVGETTLLQLAFEFGQDKSLTNYATVSSKSDQQDQTVDHRFRSDDEKYIADLKQQTCRRLSLNDCSKILETKTAPKKGLGASGNSTLVKDLDEWRTKVAKFDDESTEYVIP